MRLPSLISIAAFALGLWTTPHAHAQRLGASLNAGTDGVGVSLTTPIAAKFNARFQASYFGYAMAGDQEIDDVAFNYDASGNLLFVSGLVDWYPMNNAVRLSGGLIVNGSGGNGTLAPTGLIDIGDRTYTSTEVGTMVPRVSFNAVAPYLGIGFGNALLNTVGFTLDVGAMYVGSPSVKIEATGMLTPMEKEGRQIEENLKWIRIYPVLSIGVSTRLL